MTSKRLHLLLLGIILLLFIGLLGGTYMLNKTLTKKGQTLTDLKAQSLALEQEKIDLARAKKQIATYSDLMKVTQSIVPEDKSQAEAVREIVKIAAANSVNLSSITFPASTLGTGTTPKGSASSSAPSSASKAASSTNSKTNTLSQLQPVPNISGVYSLIINVQNDTNHTVTYKQLINFLDGLEHNRRTAQVSTISIQPDTKNSSQLTFTLTLNEYIKP